MKGFRLSLGTGVLTAAVVAAGEEEDLDGEPSDQHSDQGEREMDGGQRVGGGGEEQQLEGVQEEQGEKGDQEEQGEGNLPPGYGRSECLGKNGKVRRFITCPPTSNKPGLKFESWRDAKLHQMKHGNHMELRHEHFLIKRAAKKNMKTAEMLSRKKSYSDIVSEEAGGSGSLAKRRKQLTRVQNNVDRLLGGDETSDHKTMLENAAFELMKFRDHLKHDEAFERIRDEIQSNKLDPEHPLNLFPGDGNDDQWAEIVMYCTSHHPKLLALLLLVTTNPGHQITVQKVREIAFLVSIVSSLSCGNRQYLNAVTKMNTVVGRASGMTYEGIDMFSRMGITLGRTATLELRTEMATLSQDLFHRYAKRFNLSIIFDNLNIKSCGKSYNFTQPLLHFQEDRFEDVPDDDEVPLAEALPWVDKEYCMLDSPNNVDLLSHYMTVTYNVLGRLIGEASKAKGKKEDMWSWMLDPDIFPRFYSHDNEEDAGKKSLLYLYKLLPLDENITDEMIKILEKLSDVLLEAVAMSVHDREAFRRDVSLMKNKDAPRDNRKEADLRVWEEVKRYGRIVIKGDLLTLERLESAKQARRRTSTLYEKLAYIMVARVGMMHASLNKVTIDFQSRLQDEHNVDDKLSISSIKTRIAGLDGITNDRKKIARDYETHCQLLEEVGKAAIFSAWDSFVSDMEEEEYPRTKDREAAVQILDKFMMAKNIHSYYRQSQEKVESIDSVDENCSDLASRALVEFIMDRVTKHGDGKGIHAVQLALIPYMLNKTGLDINSKYASFLALNHVDFMRSSSRMKKLLYRYATVNYCGYAGHNIPFDMANEHYVGTVKKIIKAMHARLTPLQVHKSIIGLNIQEYLLQQAKLSLGFTGRRGGGTSRRRMTKEQVEEIHAMFAEVKPYKKRSQKIIYEQKLHSIYSGLSDDRLDVFFKNKKDQYRRCRNVMKF